MIFSVALLSKRRTYLLKSLQLDLWLAARNVLRQRRRSGVAVAAVGFGIVALLLAGGFIDFIFFAMREDAIHSHLGHVRMAKPGYHAKGLADPFAYLLPAQDPALESMKGEPGMTLVAQRLSFTGLVSTGDSSLSCIGEGVEPAKEEKLSKMLLIEQGEPLSESDPKGIIVGQGLAQNLGVKPGDNLIVMATTAAGGINAIEGKVRGLFSTPTKAYDDVAIRIPLAMSRNLLKVDGSHVWIGLLDETERTDAAVRALRSASDSASFEVIPWLDLADFYRKTVELFTRQVAVVKFIIAVIIVLSISNTLTMSVMERTSEIGTSMALGMRRGRILRQFVFEGMVIGMLGGTAGVIIGLALAWSISSVGIPMPPPPGMARGFTAEIHVGVALLRDALLIALGTTLVASLLPAIRASRLNIVDALRTSR